MFKLFINRRYEYNYPVKEYSRFDYIKRRYNSELEKIKEYYRGKDFAVNNNHLLNRLITIASPSVNLYILDYLSTVEVNARFMSKQFDIVSNIHNGAILDNIFFGTNSKEILLYRDSVIDINTIEENWRSLEAVRVVYTEETDLDFYLPFNRKNYIVPTLHIMTIDVPLLLVQYKLWSLERMDLAKSTNPNVFIAQIVLPNMMNNMLDLAIWNRYIKISKNEKINPFRVNHPFAVLDYSEMIDGVLKDVVRDTKEVNIPIEQILLTVKPIYKDNMLDVLFIGHKYFTKQAEWVLWLARLPVITDIIELLNEQGIKRNLTLINLLPTTIKEMKNNSILNNKFNGKNEFILLDDFKMDLNIIKNRIGVR